MGPHQRQFVPLAAEFVTAVGGPATSQRVASPQPSVEAEIPIGPEARVSVCIPTYNLAGYLDTAIISCLRQTSKPWEILVSDDESTDNTREVLRKYSSEVRILHVPAHVGLAGNYRYVVSQATGTHVVFLSADDALAPTFIEEVEPYLYSSGMVTTGGFDCNERMEVLRYRGGSYFWRKPLVAPAGFHHYLQACTYLTSGTIFRRDAVLNVPPLPGEADSVFDWYLGLMIGRTETVRRLWRPLYYYRYHESNTSHSNPAKWLANASAMFDFLLREVAWSDEERFRVEERARSFVLEVLDQPLASFEQPWKDVLTAYCERWLSPEDARATGDGHRDRDPRGSTARGLAKGFVRELVSKGVCRAVDHPSYLVR